MENDDSKNQSSKMTNHCSTHQTVFDETNPLNEDNESSQRFLSYWIHSIHIVTFDIEFGQALESSYPATINGNPCLRDKERNNICYSSFPDSNSSILGSTQFHFRIKTNLTSDQSSSSNSYFSEEIDKVYGKYNESVPHALQVDKEYINGYVHFLQRKDAKLKRGYFQKSLVILSYLPFTELFKFIVSTVGKEYFEDEKLLYLKTFYQRTCYWPPLLTNSLLDLNIQGSMVAFFIPDKFNDKQSTNQSNSITSSLISPSNNLMNKIRSKQNSQRFTKSSQIAEIFSLSNNAKNLKEFSTISGINQYNATTDHGTPISLEIPHYHYKCILTAFDLDLYKSFNSIIPDLQLLWEMILTCEPFIVIAPTPDLSSNFVQCLTSLIYPFRYSLDHRPFFTIHDQEFKDYAGLRETSPNALLGVTNPFFTKSLEHWPNVIHLSNIKTSKSTDQLSSLLINQVNSAATANTFLSSTNNNKNITSKNSLVDKLGNFVANESHKSGLSTKVKPFLSKDRVFLSKVLRSDKTHESNRPNNIQTALIRRWLVELTQSFFMPLERFLVQLMPLHNKISPFKAPPELPEFDIEGFLASLEFSGPQLTTSIRGDWVGLYKKFFLSKNFHCWFNYRKADIDKKLSRLHMESFLEIDLPSSIKSKAEIEIVDLIIVLRTRLEKSLDLPANIHSQFKVKLNELIDLLPDDMRYLFL